MTDRRGNKTGGNRVSLPKTAADRGVGGEHMVKGVSRRMIEVPSPDPDIFEKAIFIVREDFVGERGMTEKDILKEAQKAVRSCAPPGQRRGRKLTERLEAPVYAAAGAATAALAWAAVHAMGLLG